MAEDWDLYAVVRSCKSTTTTSSWAVSDSASVTTTTMMDSMQGSGQTTSSSSVDTLSCLASLTFEEENDPFSFPNLVADQPQPRTTNTSEELQQFYMPFFSNNNNNNNNHNPTTITGTTTNFAQGIIPNSPISDFGGSSGQQHQLLHYQEQHQQHHHYHHHQQQQQQQQKNRFGTSNDVVVGPRFMPRQPYISGYGGVHRGRRQYQLHELDRNHHQVPVLLPRTPDRHHHHHHQVNNKTTITTPTVTLPLAPFQLPTIPMSSMPRSRKRKNQQKKTVCHVTADNLSTDVWAWRKYGQKPIKGSPFPRNYYRCSSSKGCAARKQVERNNNDPESFIITYTGDHTHPRPTHRNSLAGSTRNKLSPPPNVTPITKNSDQSPSTTTPKLSPAPQTEQDPAAKTLVILPEERESDDQKQSDVISMEEEELMMDIDALNEDHEDEDEGVLIPNMSLADDDFFLGLKEFGCTTPGAAC